MNDDGPMGWRGQLKMKYESQRAYLNGPDGYGLLGLCRGDPVRLGGPSLGDIWGPIVRNDLEKPEKGKSLLTTFWKIGTKIPHWKDLEVKSHLSTTIKEPTFSEIKVRWFDPLERLKITQGTNSNLTFGGLLAGTTPVLSKGLSSVRSCCAGSLTREYGVTYWWQFSTSSKCNHKFVWSQKYNEYIFN